VTAVIKAWDDNTVNVKSVTDEVLQCLFVPRPVAPLASVLLNRCRFHPEFQNHSSQIQREMLAGMRLWLQSLGHKQSETLGRLTKQAVHGHQNVRPGSEGSASMSQGTFSANAGGRREGDGFGTPRRGSTSVPDSAPPIPPVPTRLGAGQPGSIYGESSFLSSSQLYVPPLPYPAGPSLGVPPLPQTHHYGSAQVDACGYHTPTQPGFPDAPGNPPYSFPPSLGFSEELGVPSHLGAARPATPGSSYRGPSYPGRPSYPGQQGMTEMPSPGNSFNATPLGPPQSAPSFPSAQPESGYGTTGYSGYGQGSYQPEY
jgi:Heterokaryon incompatibility protein Het-C